MAEKQDEDEIIYEIPTNFSEARGIYKATVKGAGGKIIHKNITICAVAYSFDLLYRGWREVNAAIQVVSIHKTKRNKTDVSKDAERIKFAIINGYHLKYLQVPTPDSEQIYRKQEVELTAEQQDLVEQALAGEMSVYAMFDKIIAISEANSKIARQRKLVKSTPEFIAGQEFLEQVRQNRDEYSAVEVQMFEQKQQQYSAQVS